MFGVCESRTSGAADGERAWIAEAAPAMKRRLTPAPDTGVYNLPAASGQRPAASGQRPAASGQRPAASGPNCVRRRSRLDRSRPNPRTGRRRAHLSLLLPALGLLLGAFSLFDAAPAQAQAVWSATLTPRDVGSGNLGCDDTLAGAADDAVCEPSGGLTDDDFTVGGTNYDIDIISLSATRTALRLSVNPAPDAALNALNFCVGSRAFAFSSLSITDSNFPGDGNWTSISPALSWTIGTGVSLKIGRGSSCTEAPPSTITVSLSAEQTTINEGEQVVLKATLSPPPSVEEARARGFPVEIPLTLSPGTSEPGDVRLPATIVVGPRTDNSVHVYAAPDADTDDEAFIVFLGGLPTGFAVGTSLSVDFTITDDDAPPQAALPPVTNFRVRATSPTDAQAEWTAPTGAGSGDITLLRLRWREQGTSDWEMLELSPSFSGVFFGYSELRPGRTYDVEMATLRSAGEEVIPSSRWVSATFTTPNYRPTSNAGDVNLDVRVTPGNRKLTLNWTMDRALKGDTAVRGYDVQYREKYTCYLDMTQGRPRYVDGVPQYVCNEWGSDGQGWFSHGSGPDNRDTTRVINGLSPGTEYQVRVRLVTSTHDSRTTSSLNYPPIVTYGNWFYATGRTAGSTNPRLRSLQLNN